MADKKSTWDTILEWASMSPSKEALKKAAGENMKKMPMKKMHDPDYMKKRIAETMAATPKPKAKKKKTDPAMESLAGGNRGSY